MYQGSIQGGGGGGGLMHAWTMARRVWEGDVPPPTQSLEAEAMR